MRSTPRCSSCPPSGSCLVTTRRWSGTIRAVERELMREGLVLRYRTHSGVDGLTGDERPFLACSFWLVTAYAKAGGVQEASALIDAWSGCANDLLLLSEEYDPVGTADGRQLPPGVLAPDARQRGGGPRGGDEGLTGGDGRARRRRLRGDMLVGMTYTGNVQPGGAADVRSLPALTIRKLAVSEMHNNVYLLTCAATGAQLLIDAADDAPRLLSSSPRADPVSGRS